MKRIILGQTFLECLLNVKGITYISSFYPENKVEFDYFSPI